MRYIMVVLDVLSNNDARTKGPLVTTSLGGGRQKAVGIAGCVNECQRKQ